MSRVPASSVLIALTLAAVALGPGPAAAQPEELRVRVPEAIKAGNRYLISRQKGTGQFDEGYGRSKTGLHSLVILALINGGVAADDPAIERAADWLRDADIPPRTYELSMAIQALVAVGDKERDYTRVGRWAEALQNAQRNTGAWDYEGAFGQRWDNSNTQFAILALRDAANFGVPVAESVWEGAEKHWIRTQVRPPSSRTGAGWSYAPGQRNETGSMTVAGIASLTITSTFLGSAERRGRLDCCGVEDESEALAAIDGGVRWLANNFSVTTNPRDGNWHFYYLYGLERAGRLTGRRFFGDADWYREGAKFLVDTQSARDGSWNGNMSDRRVDTALAILFLSKGLSPILMNKLKYGDAENDPLARRGRGDLPAWNRHPRDVRNLAEYLTTRPKWPKLLSWQEVDLAKAAAQDDVEALLQAPVQVIEGDADLAAISPRQRELLAACIEQGGFLLIVNNCGSEAFERAARDLVADLVPDASYTLERLPPTHDIYRAEDLFTENPPPLWGVDFGCRTAIVYAPDDHACRWNAWNRNLTRSYTEGLAIDISRSMRLGANILSYATGRELVDKLSSPEAVDRREVPLRENPLPVARLRHQGGWDAAPAALGNLLAAVRRFGIDSPGRAPVVSGDDEQLYRYPLLYMHGRRNFDLAPAERDGLVDHLNSGGVLFADACCGADAFDQSFRTFVQEALGEPLERIPAGDELFTLAGGYDIDSATRRIPAGTRSGPLEADRISGEPYLEGVRVDGRWAVIYSKYDLSCALERQATVACEGYIVEDAVRIGTNVILYSVLQDVVAAPGE